MSNAMSNVCPRCRHESPPAARYCASCGLALDLTEQGAGGAGRVRHPQPAAVPPGAIPVEDATQLYFTYESALGGHDLSGTEGLRIRVANVGYPLQELQFEVRGIGRDGAPVLRRVYEVPHLGHADWAEIETPSYDIAGPLRILHVKLIGAQFAPADETT